MIITVEELLGRKEFIHHEILSSLTDEVMLSVDDKRQYEVKLLVNGIELEPKFFNDLINNIEKYIEKEAQKLINDRCFEAEMKARKLEETVKEAIENIREEFIINNKF